MKVRHLRHRARPAPKAEHQAPLRCIRCGRRIKVALHGMGPTCARRAGYVPMARTRVKAIHQPDLFDALEPTP